MDAARAVKRNLDEANSRAEQHRRDGNIDDELVALCVANAYRECLTFIDLERKYHAKKNRG